MRYKIRHITQYQYAQRVTSCYNLANIVPRDTKRQRCISNNIAVSPQPSMARSRTDYFGNQAYHFEIQSPHKELVITADSEIEIDEIGPALNLDLGIPYADAQHFLTSTQSQDCFEAREYLLDSPMVARSDALAAYAQPSFTPERSLRACVAELTTRIFEDFAFDPDFSNIATPLSEVLAHKRGVCQDFAHLQVGCLRSVGIPAKYVSGYIETLPAPGEEKLVGADATHAWVAYFCPDEGWLEYDPTNNTAAGNQHIVTALGRDYFDVTPLKGVIFGGGADPLLSVSVDVRRIEDMA